MRWQALLLGLGMIAGAVYIERVSAEVPKPRPVSDSWQLKFIYENLQAIKVKVPGFDEPETFWYLRYTVVNQTSEDRIYVPDFILYTESGDLYRAGRGVPQVVYETIKQVHNDPLMRTSTAMIGKLLQGEDNAKRGVAIWPDFDTKSSMVDIFVGGLSGETVELVLPQPITRTLRTAKGKEQVIVKTKVILSKTLQMRYKVAGDKASRYLNTPVLASMAWVMR